MSRDRYRDPMAFLNPFFLIGVIGAAIPIVVHLVRRTRAERVKFASLMFLRRIEQKTVRRRTLRNLLLLALRCAAILLLALAFARPYFTWTGPDLGGSTHDASVILIDTSASISYPGVFERAQNEARNILSAARAGDRFAIAAFDTGLDIVMPMKADRGEAASVLDGLRPGPGATDFAQAVQSAASLVREESSAGKTIYLISDFQRSAAGDAGVSARLPETVRLVPVDISDREPSNLVVGGIRSEAVVYAQKYPGRLAARVVNYGATARRAVVELKLNDLTVERREVEFEPGDERVVEFSGFNVPEGSNRAAVEAAVDDGLRIDNASYFTIERRSQTRVLVIETATRGRSESFYLRQALLAGENAQHAVTIKSPGSTSPAEAGSHDLVVVNDVAAISEPMANALAGFVERGGGLLIAAGKHADPREFNRVFSNITPARLEDRQQIRTGYALMSQVLSDHPVFGVFARGGRLASTRVYAYQSAVPVEGSTVIAALDNGSPLLIEKATGSGKVLLFTSTLDTTWNDLPVTPMFLPLLRQIFEYLEGGRGAAAYEVGQVFAAPPDREGNRPLIESPGGGRVEDARIDSTGAQLVTARETGFYRIRYRDRVDYRAVNTDPAESDLEKLDVQGFIASITRSGELAEAGSAESLMPRDIEGRQRVWLWLLLAALGLFVAEAVLARRIRIIKLAG